MNINAKKTEGEEDFVNKLKDSLFAVERGAISVQKWVKNLEVVCTIEILN